MMKPTPITITLDHEPRPERGWPKWMLRRWQPWRWNARRGNAAIIANGGEAYTNKGDAIKRIETLCDPRVPVVLKVVKDGEVIETRVIREGEA